MICITIGRNTDRLYGRWHDTIWNNHLEVISEIKLAKISDTFFTTLEESKMMSEKRLARWRESRTGRKELGAAYKSVALRYIRRQPHMKTCKPEDIENVARIATSDGRVCYQITAKGKKFSFSPRKG
jgi:hypothetical protein